MLLFNRFLGCLLVMIVVALPSIVFSADTLNIPILCYHNFNPTIPGSMNMSTKKFEEQLKLLKDNGFTVVSLKDVVDYLQGKRATLPQKPVVITADDGWKSVYIYMLPLIKKYNVPVTLFIYPQTISQGKNAMTWEELKELQRTGLFDIQGHTYSHPNFKHERKRLSSSAYEKFVNQELVKSKAILEEKLGTKISFLAWPFGIYDNYLEQEAAKAGYVMAFTIDARTANKSYRPMAQPRFMIIEDQSMKTFAGIVNRSGVKGQVVSAKK